MEVISAILNKHTKGTLYFGIDDNGFVKGQQISDNIKKEIDENVNKSEKTIQKAINLLIDKGLVVRIGSNKEGYWKIVNK